MKIEYLKRYLHKNVKLQNYIQLYLIILITCTNMIVGEVTMINENEYRISTMEKTGSYWRWPENKDEIWYEEKDIIKTIYPPIVVGSRGQFSFDF